MANLALGVIRCTVLKSKPLDPAAPTIAELEAGEDFIDGPYPDSEFFTKYQASNAGCNPADVWFRRVRSGRGMARGKKAQRIEDRAIRRATVIVNQAAPLIHKGRKP